MSVRITFSTIAEPATAPPTVTAIAATTAADRVRDRARLRKAKRHDSGAVRPNRPIRATTNGVAQIMPNTTPTVAITTINGHTNEFELSVRAPVPATTSRPSPPANRARPVGTNQRGGATCGRRPASADITGTREAERAGTAAATVPATIAVTAITTRSRTEMTYAGRSWLSMLRVTMPRTNGRAPSASPIPATVPINAVQVPWSASERRITPYVAPFDASWPTVTSCRLALVANAAATMMPTATSDSTPATHPQARIGVADQKPAYGSSYRDSPPIAPATAVTPAGVQIVGEVVHLHQLLTLGHDPIAVETGHDQQFDPVVVAVPADPADRPRAGRSVERQLVARGEPSIGGELRSDQHLADDRRATVEDLDRTRRPSGRRAAHR